MRLGRVVALQGWDGIREAYPGPDEFEQLLAGIESMHVLPLHGGSGAVGVGFEERRALTPAEQRLLDAIAEELGRALDRAALLESEREARLQAEAMERNAERLAAAATAVEVAAATVDEIASFGADVVFVWGLGEAGRLETLAASGVPDETAGRFGVYPLDHGGLVSDAMSGRRLVAVESAEEYDALYPALAEERRRIGAESLVAMPLRTGRGDVIGAVFAAATRRRWVTAGRRALLLGIAEQTGVALIAHPSRPTPSASRRRTPSSRSSASRSSARRPRAAARDASSTRSRKSEPRSRRCTSSHSRKRWRR